MSNPGQQRAGERFSQELRPYVDRSEAAGINRTGERLVDARPVPRAGFRAELHARLGRMSREAPAWRPRRVGRLIAAYAGSGILLLAVAAIGLTGAGPLGY